MLCILDPLLTVLAWNYSLLCGHGTLEADLDSIRCADCSCCQFDLHLWNPSLTTDCRAST